jgi:hypothetical protein
MTEDNVNDELWACKDRYDLLTLSEGELANLHVRLTKLGKLIISMRDANRRLFSKDIPEMHNKLTEINMKLYMDYINYQYQIMKIEDRLQQCQGKTPNMS